ncbi:MAG: metallophosphoesterase [Micavibrio sp.]|nr:metallophosphoesterase [Micavibrio sp.]
MKITFNNHEFILDPSGALLWPEKGMLIVADLHLEKSSHFAKRGYFLPPYDSHETLTRLMTVLMGSGMKRLLILGDCFHDRQGYERLNTRDYRIFDELRDYDPIWIRGNHDGDFVPSGMASYDVYHEAGISFRHEPSGQFYEISGHLHPKATIQYHGTLISRRCFIENDERMIIPAFGSYTGGLDVLNTAISRYFSVLERVHLLGEDKIYSVPAGLLMRS